MKICNHCQESKNEDSFGKDKRNKDGLQGTCKSCQNAIRRNRYSNDKIYRNNTKARQKKYNDYALLKAKNHIQGLSDTYIIAALKRGTDLNTEDIRKHPELIEAKRQIIKNQRLLRCQ